MASPMFPVPQSAQTRGATDIKWFAGLAESAREEIALWAFRMGQAMAAADQRLHASE